MSLSKQTVFDRLKRPQTFQLIHCVRSPHSKQTLAIDCWWLLAGSCASHGLRARVKRSWALRLWQSAQPPRQATHHRCQCTRWAGSHRKVFSAEGGATHSSLTYTLYFYLSPSLPHSISLGGLCPTDGHFPDSPSSQ